MHLEFFKISSQIIPILFIAFVLQSAFISKSIKYKKEERREAIIHADNFLFASFIMVIAEARSLQVIYNGKSFSDDVWLVGFAMLIPAYIFMAEYVFTLMDKPKTAWRKANSFLWIVMLVIFIATLSSHRS